MNRFTPLLQNQTLVIDNHQPGKPLEWGKGLHIDKRFRGEKRGGFNIRFPIDVNMGISIDPKGDTRAPEVLKEIKNALKDDQVRSRFARDIYSAIEEFKGDNVSVGEVRDIAERVARNFGIDGKIVSEIIEIHEGRIRRHSSQHIAQDTGKSYEITQTPGKIKAKESNGIFGTYFKHSRRF